VIVVDVNVVTYLWLPGPLTTLAEACAQIDPDWHAPLLWRSEMRNLLAGFVRHKLLDWSAAEEAMQRAEASMRGKEHIVASAAVVSLLARSRCSAYDCEYAALAEEKGVKLVTNDKQLTREFPKLAVSLADFATRKN
jgi:predicted nucleic acid-binding protein